ncbi:MAG: glutaminyl-peptide cyclotransferase [Anaerolineaceae bacterium]|jgi:glutamine cyclotransferase|nr:glutaminyl-peptide cyclotransferase [Anaerolineaceae bacterium]MDD4042748.1 glutaminyl-peptide cyclotransferase [Anaerolineaceae bacterium]MDD4577845.1 glutaminyl-peptide cyclotransferase [Anaerolineaceae bacterium]
MINKKYPLILLLTISLLILSACQGFTESLAMTPTPTSLALGDYGGYRVINRFPHDPSCYTQGLIYRDGFFYESCGLYGQSSLRKVDPQSGEVLQEVTLEEQYFAEGLMELDGLLYQLTWREGTAFIYDLESFEKVGQFSYSTEGWGLTSDGTALILSDGSNKLFWFDPTSGFSHKATLVTWQDHPIEYLNELEFINGKIYANIYLSEQIAIINPETGLVETMLDMRGLRPEENLTDQGEVLNGIAYDAETDRLFITGKKWQWLYEIELIPISPPSLSTETPLPSATPPLPVDSRP